MHAWGVLLSVAFTAGECKDGSGEVPLEESSWLWCESEEDDGESELGVSWVACFVLALYDELTW